jgi:acyl-[acyl carrier protein]--UDP-N-acetylglucosamine O-acyltransferase
VAGETSRAAFVLDLRAPVLLALSGARHGRRTLLSACVDGVAGAGIAVRVVVAGAGAPQDRTPSVRALIVAPDELAGSLAGGVPIVWFNALAMDLDGGDVARLLAGHLARGSSATPVCGKREALRSEAASLGWVVERAALERLLAGGRPDGDASVEPMAIDRSVISNLEDWASFLRDDRRRRAEWLLQQGVELLDWTTLHVSGELQCGAGVVIGAHVAMEGRVELEQGVRIASYTYLRDVHIGANTEVKSFSSLEDVAVGTNCRVGPHARLRTKTIVEDDVSIGNFVELKATTVGSRGRINHFAFLGDAVLGPDVTIGAGVITCNHDGAKSVATRIDSGVYVGSGSQLVAPLTIGRDATIGAGSTITDDVEPGGLTLGRARQVRVQGWKRKGGK